MKTVYVVYKKNIPEIEKRMKVKEKTFFYSESDAKDFIEKKKGFMFQERCDLEIFETLMKKREEEDPSLTLIIN